MFENIISFFKKLGKKEDTSNKESSNTAKERLHLVLMQDRANVSADFLELMKQEIIEVIKKYIDVDEKAIDVRLTNKANEDGTVGAPALYANIPIVTIKNEARIANAPQNENKVQKQELTQKEDIKQESKKQNEDSKKGEKETIKPEKKENKEENKKNDAEKKVKKPSAEKQLKNKVTKNKEENTKSKKYEKKTKEETKKAVANK